VNLESLVGIFLKEKEEIKAGRYGKKSKKIKTGTIRIYKYKLQGFLEFLKEKGITNSPELNLEVISLYSKEIQAKKQGVKNGAHNALWLVQSFLRWLKEKEAILFEAEESLALPKQERIKKEPVSLEKVQRQISRLESKDFERNALIFALHFLEGLTIKEIQSLSMFDLDLEEGQIRLTQKKRFHYLQKKTMEYLKKYLKIRGQYLPRTDYLLVSKQGIRMTEELIRKIIRESLKR